jgi:hypothetical protein
MYCFTENRKEMKIVGSRFGELILRNKYHEKNYTFSTNFFIGFM